MTREELIQAARHTAKAHGLNPALVCALCEVESSWNPKATRYEAVFQYRYIDPLGLPSQEAQDRSTSWGLMQVMGQTAIELGWKGPLQDLLEPVNSLEWGCRKLAQCFKNMPVGEYAESTRLALLAYNGGADKLYPQRVLSKLPKYQGEKVEEQISALDLAQAIIAYFHTDQIQLRAKMGAALLVLARRVVAHDTDG